jgi:hypothetical protein
MLIWAAQAGLHLLRSLKKNLPLGRGAQLRIQENEKMQRTAAGNIA